MNEYDLNYNEVFLIESIRQFDFLKRLGYFGSRFTIHDIHLHVSFSNYEIDRQISISYEGDLFISISRNKAKFFPISRYSRIFEIDSMYEFFDLSRIVALKTQSTDKDGFIRDDCYGAVLKEYAAFIQDNLFPVLIGVKWINELIGISRRSTRA